MKQSQLTVAVILLAVMIFVVTFAMNYLGGTVGTPAIPDNSNSSPSTHAGYLEFPQTLFPPDRSVLEQEEHSKGFIDYWFHNPTDIPVKMGLDRKGCRCTSVEAFVLTGTILTNSQSAPQSLTKENLTGVQQLATVGATVSSLRFVNPLDSIAAYMAGIGFVQSSVRGIELLAESDQVVATVPEHGMGWVRLRWNAERSGAQGLNALLWMGDRMTGKTARLEMSLFFHDIIRVKPVLSLGSIKDENLEQGLSGSIICWSSTRTSLDLDIKPATIRHLRGGDPLVIGRPVPLEKKAIRELQLENNSTPEMREKYGGSVLCAYSIPISMKAKSEEGKIAFDLGPFRRRVILSTDGGSHEKQILVEGLIRGIVEIGGDLETNHITFQTFKSSRGKRQKIVLFSELPDLQLSFDEERTPSWLKATLKGPMKVLGNRQSWEMVGEVLPGKATGPFPRKEDPAYEDSAIYLRAISPGKKDYRSIRIAVTGTAAAG